MASTLSSLDADLTLPPPPSNLCVCSTCILRTYIDKHKVAHRGVPLSAKTIKRHKLSDQLRNRQKAIQQAVLGDAVLLATLDVPISSEDGAEASGTEVSRLLTIRSLNLNLSWKGDAPGVDPSPDAEPASGGPRDDVSSIGTSHPSFDLTPTKDGAPDVEAAGDEGGGDYVPVDVCLALPRWDYMLITTIPKDEPAQAVKTRREILSALQSGLDHRLQLIPRDFRLSFASLPTSVDEPPASVATSSRLSLVFTEVDEWLTSTRLYLATLQDVRDRDVDNQLATLLCKVDEHARRLADLRLRCWEQEKVDAGLYGLESAESGITVIDPGKFVVRFIEEKSERLMADPVVLHGRALPRIAWV